MIIMLIVMIMQRMIMIMLTIVITITVMIMMTSVHSSEWRRDCYEGLSSDTSDRNEDERWAKTQKHNMRKALEQKSPGFIMGTVCPYN